MAGLLNTLFPCPCGTEAKKKLVELQGGDPEPAPEPATWTSWAVGKISSAAAPVTQFRQRQEEAAARDERFGKLQAGATMKLLPDARGAKPLPVRVALSPDGAMVTWVGVGGSESGVMALSAVREVKNVLTSGFFSRGDPIPGQWMLVADDQTVRFEASSDGEKAEWMATLEEACTKEAEAKSGRKMAYSAKRKSGLEERRKEAERRKAELMKSCGSGGMKHTAAAMMNRG